jgi:hypothetical protein
MKSASSAASLPHCCRPSARDLAGAEAAEADVRLRASHGIGSKNATLLFATDQRSSVAWFGPSAKWPIACQFEGIAEYKPASAFKSEAQ